MEFKKVPFVISEIASLMKEIIKWLDKNKKKRKEY